MGVHAVAGIRCEVPAHRHAVPLVWLANTWGLVGLLNGIRGVLQLNVPSFNLSTVWHIYTFYAPVVIASHLMIFAILIKSKSWNNNASYSAGAKTS